MKGELLINNQPKPCATSIDSRGLNGMSPIGTPNVRLGRHVDRHSFSVATWPVYE